MKYWAVFLLAAALWSPELAANTVPTPPATPTPNMHVEELSNGISVCTLVDNDPADFGRECPPTLVGQLSSWVTIRISNEQSPFGGGNVLNLTLPTVTAGGGDFTLSTGGFSNSLQIGTSTEFRVSFSPQSAGARSGEVTFTYEADPYVNPGIYTPFRLNVTGQGLTAPAPVVRVEEGFPFGTDVYHDAPAIAGRAFGKRKLDAGSTDTISITVFNSGASGAADLNLGTPQFVSGGSEFVLNLAGFTATLAPTFGTTFTVSFDPAVAGIHTGVIEFSHDDAYQPSPFRIQVTGEGIAESAQIRVSDSTGPWFDTSGMVPQYIGTHLAENAAPAGARDFGAVDGGNTATSTLTIANADVGVLLWAGYQPGETLTLGTPSVIGDADFTLDLTGFSTTVTSAATVSLVVRFSPIADGVRTAVIEIPHGDGSEREPFRVNVTGIGANTVGTGGGPGSGGGGSGCVAADGGACWLLLALLAITPALLRRRVA